MSIVFDGSNQKGIPIVHGGTGITTITANNILTAIATPNKVIQAISLGASSQLFKSSGATILPSFQMETSVLQVVVNSTTTPVTVTASSYTDTGLSATITPTSASSQILVLFVQSSSLSRAINLEYFGIRLYRGATLIHEPASDVGSLPFDWGVKNGGTSMVFNNMCHLFILDSPNTTSAVTYKTQAKTYHPGTNSSAVTFQNNPGTTNGTSRILLAEIIS